MLFQIGFASFADLDPGRATGLKDASRLRSIDRIRLSPGDATAAPQGRIGSRNGRNEGFGVRMGRLAADRFAGAGLDNPAAIHDGDPVAHVTDDPEVMGDEQVGQGELLLERLRRLRICAWIETSREDTGSSAMISLGRRMRARAIPILCLCRR
jgi:hypothetical protein